MPIQQKKRIQKYEEADRSYELIFLRNNDVAPHHLQHKFCENTSYFVDGTHTSKGEAVMEAYKIIGRTPQGYYVRSVTINELAYVQVCVLKGTSSSQIQVPRKQMAEWDKKALKEMLERDLSARPDYSLDGKKKWKKTITQVRVARTACIPLEELSK